MRFPIVLRKKCKLKGKEYNEVWGSSSPLEPWRASQQHERLPAPPLRIVSQISEQPLHGLELRHPVPRPCVPPGPGRRDPPPWVGVPLRRHVQVPLVQIIVHEDREAGRRVVLDLGENIGGWEY